MARTDCIEEDRLASKQLHELNPNSETHFALKKTQSSLKIRSSSTLIEMFIMAKRL